MAAPAGVLGPMDGAAVVALVRSGEARPDTQICSTDDRVWIEMRYVGALAGEMARLDAIATAAQESLTAPPPPGEPWFYNVSPGRAMLLEILSLHGYAAVWSIRHREWIERRAGPLGSPIWQLRFDKWLPRQIATAAEQVGVRDRILLDLAPIDNGLLLLSGLCGCFMPITLAVGFHKLLQAQEAAEIVNQAVAPDAPRPPMGLGEWMAVLLGLAGWIGLPLLLVLHVWVGSKP